MTTNQNHDNASKRMRFNTCDNYGVAPWSYLNHDVLFIVMMQLGVIDFLAFSGVCKSWRSLALSNNKKFMASRPPMLMWICGQDYTNDSYCNLDDFEGRNSKTIIPHSAGRSCMGLTCGYLVLYGWETKDYWLVNPITRDELYFPALPCLLNPFSFRAILVFSPSVNEWVFVVLNNNLYFSIAGEGVWNHVSSTAFSILDLHAFKGKIYTLDTNWGVCEMRLNPEPKLTLLEIKNLPNQNDMIPVFISSDENLYVTDRRSRYPDINIELDFGEMKWGSSKEKTIGEYAIQSAWEYGAVFKPESWLPSKYRRYDCFLDTINNSKKCGVLVESMWYFPHDCLKLNRLEEE